MGIASMLIYLMIVIYFASLWKIFEKAGRTAKWEGFVPVYNILIWLKVIKKPWWWIFFFIVPLVNIIVTVAMNVETARLFGKYTPKDTILCIICPWYYIPFLAFKDENQLAAAPTDWTKKEDREKRTFHDHITLFFMAPFIGHAVLLIFKLIGSKQRPGKGSMEYEWTNAIGFAVVAATIIRTFAFEAFTIPTGSMEKTMRIGDYLFVNKWKYGARSPMTPLSVPFIHNRLPGSFTKSYVDWIEMDYFRLPGYGEMTRGDIMVFNWPVGDTVLLHNDIVAHDYYQIVRNEAIVPYVMQGKVMTKEDFRSIANQAIALKRKQLLEGAGLEHTYVLGSDITETKGYQTLTLDKKENYVKRCVAIHGDDLEIKDGMISINGVEQPLPVESQFQYTLYGWKGGIPAYEYFDENYGIYMQDFHVAQDGSVTINATQDVINKIKALGACDSVVCDIQPLGFNYVPMGQYCPIYPNHPDYDWSRDNFGPLHIPEKGWTIDLTDSTMWILYKRAITAYEYNESIEEKPDGIYINGVKTDKYTFKQNYYWMMGDNRHGSVDSRYWGFVGEDHIVGTASFVWMSKHPEKGWFSGGLRWDRVFSFVK